mmetsp:Transcript_72911/g.235749  ORF Transcript_72911/g.235749 Transcript_72911/m.235749 type:complete len:243 (-) Transcript_72911:548-1276(-)
MVACMCDVTAAIMIMLYRVVAFSFLQNNVQASIKQSKAHRQHRKQWYPPPATPRLCQDASGADHDPIFLDEPVFVCHPQRLVVASPICLHTRRDPPSGNSRGGNDCTSSAKHGEMSVSGAGCNLREAQQAEGLQVRCQDRVVASKLIRPHQAAHRQTAAVEAHLFDHDLQTHIIHNILASNVGQATHFGDRKKAIRVEVAGLEELVYGPPPWHAVAEAEAQVHRPIDDPWKSWCMALRHGTL